MKHINGSYATYFNVRHKRAGYLFQGLGSEGGAQAVSRKPEIVKSVGLTPCPVSSATLSSVSPVFLRKTPSYMLPIGFLPFLSYPQVSSTVLGTEDFLSL